MNPMQTSTLNEQFRNPSDRYRTLQIIHNFDSFGTDEASLRQRLEWLKSTGIGGLVCNVSFKDYMRSEEQWRIFLTGLKVAEELGLVDDIAAQGWAGMPTRELGRIGGRIGGNMVRVMIRAAEQQLAGSDGE